VLIFLIFGGVGIVLLLLALIVGDHLDGLFTLGNDMFSGAALAGFLGAFGFAGAMVLDATGSTGAAIGGGVVSGAVVGAGAGYLFWKLKGSDSGENVRTADLVGRGATVVTEIPPDGYGTVSIVASGHLTTLNARSFGGLAAGSPVVITAVLSPTSVAVKADD